MHVTFFKATPNRIKFDIVLQNATFETKSTAPIEFKVGGRP
jgi:hypothetical protein